LIYSVWKTLDADDLSENYEAATDLTSSYLGQVGSCLLTCCLLYY